MKDRPTFVLMTLVCIGPPLNIIFDYFALNEPPQLSSAISTIFAIIIYFVYISLKLSK